MSYQENRKQGDFYVGDERTDLGMATMTLDLQEQSVIRNDDMTWDAFHPAPNTAISRESGNRTFNLLWAQAMFVSQSRTPLNGIGCEGMQVSCVMDSERHMAIKVVTHAGCKVLIFPDEPGMMDPLDVRLVNSVPVRNVVDEHGRISFSSPFETPELATLLRRLEDWTVAFTLVHGPRMAGLPPQGVQTFF